MPTLTILLQQVHYLFAPSAGVKPETAQSRLNLVGWFALTSLICIAMITVVSAHLQSRFLTEEILRRDATVTKEFVESILQAENTFSFFAGTQPGQSNPQLESFFNHISNMPDVMGANVFDAGGKVLWSTSAEIVGQSFPDNDELEEALKGELVFESGTIGSTDKQEHANLRKVDVGQKFVETYVPIWNNSNTKVLGAVELYKVPRALQQSVQKGMWMIWGVAAAGGALLFLGLFWIVSRADRIISNQHRRLMDIESLAMIGETAAAVTHSIRNPLASIRASAEVALGDNLKVARTSAHDIIVEVDRLNGWTRDLLAFSRAHDEPLEPVDLNSVLHTSIEQHKSEFERDDIRLEIDLAAPVAKINGANAPLNQVFASLMTNAIDAMPDGGTLHISSCNDTTGQNIVATFTDSGPGLSDDLLDSVQKPFVSTKPNGTGLGLPLSWQIVERFGGTLNLASKLDCGLTVTVSLPLAH